jgi:hypothetical protein
LYSISIFRDYKGRGREGRIRIERNSGSLMARSGKRNVREYDGLERFRRRRLLAFLRRNNLPATFAAYVLSPKLHPDRVPFIL